MTIAGSDSGGGAGIQADLKTFEAAGVHGTCAVTCITAQNPNGLRGMETVSPPLLEAQIAAVCESFPVGAIKTGMLYSSELIEIAGQWMHRTPRVPWVIDPVLVATSGALLLKPEALDSLKKLIFPKAAILTPNIPEAEVLIGHKIPDVESMREAARTIFKCYGTPVLLKGGHLATGKLALDIFYNGIDEWLLQAPRLLGIKTHGTGCTYSAAIAAHLALGATLFESVVAGKKMVTKAIHQSFKTGRHRVLHP